MDFSKIVELRQSCRKFDAKRPVKNHKQNVKIICQCCLEPLPTGSEFCQYCGKKIKKPKNKSKIIKKVFAIVLSVVLLAGAGTFVCLNYGIPYFKYNKAVKLLKNEQFYEAIWLFEDLDGFGDSEEMLKVCRELLAESFEKDVDSSSLLEKAEKHREYHEEKRKKNSQYNVETNENGWNQWVKDDSIEDE